ncbi:hypothetical protein BKA56DRAFT_602425 [Ilyonectria sp. MPI-CAGE-AT-0026]|nr:hypothetical protein BKA56DRAFT_602425 [Ilyonectria sp. MPI-CAGE-AT-0026]
MMRITMTELGLWRTCGSLRYVVEIPDLVRDSTPAILHLPEPILRFTKTPRSRI